MIVSPVALFAVPYTADILNHNLPGCLTNNFYGIFGEQAVFKLTDAACLDTQLVQHESGVFVPLQHQQLVWIQQSAIDVSLQTPEYDAEVDDFLRWLRTEDAVPPSDHQTVLLTPDASSPLSLVYLNGRSGIVAVPDDDAAYALSSFLPQFWKASPIPSTPVAYLPVPEHAVDHIRDLLAFLRFDPVVASIVDGLSATQMRKDIRYLTNEDGESGIVSRHSFASGSRVAADWLKGQFEEAGATCELRYFLEGFAPNVVCKYSATTETSATVLISGHYDSRGSFGSTRAPGGNDDGSGTISILAIARRIGSLGLKFRCNVELVAFAGEEQGLLGSNAYAKELRAQGANLTLMIQADMIGYHAPGEPAQLGLPMYVGTPEVADLVAKIAAIYSPELTVGYSAACCSDHQSFHQQGYPATQVFERAGPIADPMYHNSGDISDRRGYDLSQVRSISKVQFATLLHAAGFDLPEEFDLKL
ncbi:Zn-dependent exopeptidase [Paxillus ammoniavirescens]|nr:Zn-dependent exopeptidase [Paxillus ammoniavirescens]